VKKSEKLKKKMNLPVAKYNCMTHILFTMKKKGAKNE